MHLDDWIKYKLLTTNIETHANLNSRYMNILQLFFFLIKTGLFSNINQITLSVKSFHFHCKYYSFTTNVMYISTKKYLSFVFSFLCLFSYLFYLRRASFLLFL